MVSNFDYLKAIQNCCRDETAFEALKQMLATAGYQIEDIITQLEQQQTSNLAWEPQGSNRAAQLSQHSPVPPYTPTSLYGEIPLTDYWAGNLPLLPHASDPLASSQLSLQAESTPPLQATQPSPLASHQLLKIALASQNFLSAVALATHQLLTNSNLDSALNQAIATLGQATGVAGVYIFQIHPHPETGAPAMSQRFGWLDEKQKPVANPSTTPHQSQFQNLEFAAWGLSRWYDLLWAGQPLSGNSPEFPTSERERLEFLQIRSILVVPIMAGGLWGLMTFTDCYRQRRWSKEEEAILMTMAANIGGVIARQQTETALRQSESRFQRMAAHLPGMIYQFLRRADGSESILFASSGYQELYELEAEGTQLDLQRIKNLIHAEDLPDYEQSVEISAATLQPWVWEGRICTPSGKTKWLQCASRPEKQTNGDIVWDGIVMDITERKWAEEAVERERRLFMGGPAIVFRWLAQPNWPVDYVSPNVTQWGLQPEDFTSGRISYTSILHPDDIARIDAEIEAYWAAGIDSFEQDYRLICPDGKVRWVCDYTVVVRNEEGKVIHNEGYVLDITARKQAEEALRESEERYRSLYNNTPVMLHSIDSSGRLVSVSDYWLATLGYEREEVIGRKSTEFLTEESCRYAEEVILPEFLQTGFCKDIPYQFVKKNGELIDVLLSATAERNERGEVSRSLAVLIDVTEGKRVEAQLYASAERDRLLGEITLRIRQSLDLDQILNTTVQEVREFLKADRVFIGHLDANCQGKVVAESVAANWTPMLGWITNDSYLKELRKLFKQGKSRVIDNTAEIEKSAFHADYYAQYQIQASLCVPIMVDDQCYGMLIANQCSGPRHWQPFEVAVLSQLASQVAIAIHQAQLIEQMSALNSSLERQVAERTAQLEKKMHELQELNRIKDVVLHTVSHDLRTSVMGTVMVLKNLLKNPEEPVTIPGSVVQRMIYGNECQLNLINSLLEAHDSAEKGVILHRELVQLSTLNQVILRDLEPLLKANQATLTTSLPKDLPLVLADPTQLGRVFENLFTHTLKHNPPGLHLTLSATLEAGMIRCTIEDNGIGMSQVECNRLFELHIRDPRASCSNSIGLQLYLCRQIITAHGGEIGVISSLESGTTFWFTLPLAK